MSAQTSSPAALQKLVTWLSPAFPVGAFAWSAGLETAIADRRVRDAGKLADWIEGALAHGGIRTDAILLAHAHRSAEDATALQELADLCLALTPSRERWMEISVTGDSYVTATKAWGEEALAKLPSPCPYPIAVGAIAAAHNIGLRDTLLAFLTAIVHGQVSVAVRLVPLGQSDGLRVMAGREERIATLADEAASAGLADIGGIAYAADIAQMRHETLEPRIFRS
jgi:urease accessory protein